MSEFFDWNAPLDLRHGALPHWRQENAIYFVTFRLVDSMPVGVREFWSIADGPRNDAADSSAVPAPASSALARWRTVHEKWVDRGTGSCVLAVPACRAVVDSALRHFDGQRYHLDEYVIAPNHVHVLVAPIPGYSLASILHSWKSFTAHRISKIPAAQEQLRRMEGRVWQKESFDHIVRGPDSFAGIREYIRAHDRGGAGSRGAGIVPIH